jgi:hypothetical protein
MSANEINIAQLLQLDGKGLIIPAGQFGEPVVGQGIGFAFGG